MFATDIAPRDEKLAALYHETRDETYFSILYKRYHQPLCQFLDRYINPTRREIDKPAIVDEVLTALHATCLGGEEIRNVQSWLYQTARVRAQEAIRHGQRKKRGGGSLQFEPLDNATPDQGEGPVATAQQKDTTKAVHACLSKLPPEEKQAIQIVYLNGLNLNEAALRLGISRATIKRRVHAGLERLRKLLDTEILSLG